MSSINFTKVLKKDMKACVILILFAVLIGTTAAALDYTVDLKAMKAFPHFWEKCVGR
jgi:uncharacterized membrane protein YwzB